MMDGSEEEKERIRVGTDKLGHASLDSGSGRIFQRRLEDSKAPPHSVINQHEKRGSEIGEGLMSEPEMSDSPGHPRW